MNLLLAAHEILAGALFYTCFCRAVKMDADTTRHGVLFVFWLLGLASVAMLAAPVVDTGWHPTWPTVFLMAAVVAVQVVTSKYWHLGVPHQFMTTTGGGNDGTREK